MKGITLNNVSNFLEGNFKYYKYQLSSSPKYLLEQYHYRLEICKDSCIPNESCEACTCPPLKKAWVTKSCNDGKKFPDLMDATSWENFKQEHNINIDKILTDHGVQQQRL
jgi:hypothetical protein